MTVVQEGINGRSTERIASFQFYPIVRQDLDRQIEFQGLRQVAFAVVAGLVACPVIGVPTSVGYGASFGGLAALLSMLNSCALGVAVVNIDNGFGAGVYAHLILSRIRNGG